MTNKEAIEILKSYRKRLTDSVSNQLDKDIEAFEIAIKNLETQKTGHWFIKEGGNVCSNCGNTQLKYTSLDCDWRPHYCPNCGADMRGE